MVSKSKSGDIDRKLLLLIAISCGVVVANIYYIQPLLGDIASYFGVGTGTVGIVATLTQLGYAAGLFFILPAADILNRKKLIVTMLGLCIISLVLMACSGSFMITAGICFLVGITSMVPQIMLPMGAQLSSPENRGRNIGTIMSGLLIGILARALPDIKAQSDLKYSSLIRSWFRMPVKYPVLAFSAVNGAITFGVFSAFWTTLTFYLESDQFGYNAGIVGLFGLFGITGATLAPVAGRMSDKKGVNFTVLIHLLVIILSLICFAALGKLVVGLIIGTILLDYGVQCCNVANQARIQVLSEAERNRITSVYMVSLFLGGAIGSTAGPVIYQNFGWYGYVILSAALIIIALIVHLISIKRI